MKLLHKLSKEQLKILQTSNFREEFNHFNHVFDTTSASTEEDKSFLFNSYFQSMFTRSSFYLWTGFKTEVEISDA